MERGQEAALPWFDAPILPQSRVTANGRVGATAAVYTAAILGALEVAAGGGERGNGARAIGPCFDAGGFRAPAAPTAAARARGRPRRVRRA